MSIGTDPPAIYGATVANRYMPEGALTDWSLWICRVFLQLIQSPKLH